LHWWAGILQNTELYKEPKTAVSKAVEERRRKNIQGTRFLIIDEVSMIDTANFAKASEIVS
jgi:hypothetical protein